MITLRMGGRRRSGLAGCVLLVLSPAVLQGAEAGAVPPPGRDNVVLIVVDALRADHLGCYGFPLATTPVMDRLARNALVGKNVYAQSNWTGPCMASMMTGTYPEVHKITKSPEDAQDRFAILPTTLRIIPEPLQANGYFTAAVTSCGWVSPTSGYGKGFTEFHLVDRDDAIIIQKAIERILANKAKPFFFYIHLLDAHDYFDLHKEYSPLARPAPEVSETMRKLAETPRADIYNWLASPEREKDLTAVDVAYLRDRYDHYVNRTDRLIGDLVDALDRERLLDRTIVILTADHGESFFEHRRLLHGGDSLYREVVRVPLILHNRPRFPKPKTLESNAESVDIFPTILDLLNIKSVSTEGVPQIQGTSLLAPRKDQIALSRAGKRMRIVFREWSLLRTETQGSFELYDLSRDPGERRNLAADRPDVVRELNALLGRKIAESLALSGKILPEDGPMDENTKKILKSLGYIK
jgi:arylsulfatase A-like enzyme